MQATPKFTKINENFACTVCGFEVPPASSTCRDHCPKCLHSLHVDNLPGDRAADCGGLLTPTTYSKHKKKGIMIHYICAKCGAEKANRFLDWDENLADDLAALLKLSSVSKNN